MVEQQSRRDLELIPRDPSTTGATGFSTSPRQSTTAPLLPSTATHCGTQNDKAVRIPVLLPKLQHLLQGEL